MRLTRLGHSCVRLEHDGCVLVIDPAGPPFADGAVALAGADAVLVTHQHGDHLDPALVAAAYAANSSLQIYVPHDTVVMINEAGAPAVGVGAGETIDAAGFTVHTYGGEHATIHPDFPVPENVAYLVNGLVYHPGDSFAVPDAEVDTLLVPASAPWMKVAEAMDFMRAVGAPRAFPIHDAVLSTPGLGLADRWLGLASDTTTYARLAPGSAVDL